MNKAQLIDVIVKKTKISKVQAGDVINTFIAAIKGSLKSGDSVTLIGFGSFSAANRAERVGRNPKTGKEIKIPATTTPKFKAGKAFKEAVAGASSAAKKKK